MKKRILISISIITLLLTILYIFILNKKFQIESVIKYIGHSGDYRIELGDKAIVLNPFLIINKKSLYDLRSFTQYNQIPGSIWRFEDNTTTIIGVKTIRTEVIPDYNCRELIVIINNNGTIETKEYSKNLEYIPSVNDILIKTNFKLNIANGLIIEFDFGKYAIDCFMIGSVKDFISLNSIMSKKYGEKYISGKNYGIRKIIFCHIDGIK